MGQYDVNGVLDYIITATGYEKVAYVGHSQGTT
jgi:pimeloyl-ACP methyl ester carboxylesterase